jgi:hypothetical protein
LEHLNAPEAAAVLGKVADVKIRTIANPITAAETMEGDQ